MSEKKLATTLNELCILGILKIDWRDDLNKKIKYYILPHRLININRELEGLIEEAKDLIKDANLNEDQKVMGLAKIIKRFLHRVDCCLYNAFKRGLDSKNYDEGIKKIPWSLLVIENWSLEILKILWGDRGISYLSLDQLRDYQYCV